ncbi:hypothetical protein ACFQQB_04715 [Nonomuraea rubra]|uniref:hypothetical protein n=1 Tax=Nonomuraea rubra TaxID=46180 RepID=UPI0036215761
MQELVGLQPLVVPERLGGVDEEEAADDALGPAQGAAQPLRLVALLGQQRPQVGVQVGLGDPLHAAVEHREGRDRQSQQLVLHGPLQVRVRQVRARPADLADGEVVQQPLVQLRLVEVLGHVPQGVRVGVVQGEHEQEQGLLGELPDSQHLVHRKRLQAAFAQVGAVAAVPGAGPPADLVVVERLQADDERVRGKPGPVRDRGPGGDDDGQRAALLRLVALEAGDPLQVVGLVHARRLQQLVEAVQHDDGQRALGGVDELRPRQLLVQRGPDAVLDLRQHVAVGRDPAQLDPERQELGGGQPGREHARQHGLARARLAEHQQGRGGGLREREVAGQEGVEVAAPGRRAQVSSEVIWCCRAGSTR